MEAYKNLSTYISLLMKASRFWGLSILVLLCLFPFGDGVAGTLQDVKARGKLIVGVKTDFPPFGFLDKKRNNKGFDIDIAKALSKELFGNEKAVEFVPVTSGNRISFLTSKKIDVAVATMSITEKRKKDVDILPPVR
jgi:polar amino acid transport system substrate-binding protein